MRIAIISDVHSNSSALREALNIINLEDIDETVFLGDLLTYGCDVNETIEQLMTFSSMNKTHFIKGNHDQIYFDMQRGTEFQYKPFPKFILESALYTGELLKNNLIDLFEWKESTVIGNVFFSHANALKYGNWSYLNTDDEIIETAKIILENGYSGGVFGHTHRPKLSKYNNLNIIQDVPFNGNVIKFPSKVGKCFVANPGSVGQPRGMQPSLLFMNISESDVGLEIKTINYDVSSHIDTIETSKLTQTTKTKLISYYKN